MFDAPADDELGALALCQFAYLQRVARKASMEFFVSTFDQLGEPTGLSRLQFNGSRGVSRRIDMPEMKKMRQSYLKAIVRTPCPRAVKGLPPSIT